MQEVYSYEQVYESALVYFQGDDLAATVWTTKYALRKNKEEWVEKSPIEMHQRLAKELARIEKKYLNSLSEEEIFNLLDGFKYLIPQGGPMAGIGNDYQIMSLSNCFVVGNEYDSYGGIMQTDQEIVQLMKRRAGVGVDLSHLRPSGAPVQNAAITSSGIPGFADRYSNSTREVAQDGRRGALMLTLEVIHPDSERFIDAKMIKGRITGANVSVKLRDSFMQAVENDEEYTQKFPIDAEVPVILKSVKARKIWDKIIHNAWSSAEPGILFWDKIISESPADCYAEEGFTTIATNPCGEIPLCAYDSCRLLAINLYSYVQDPFTTTAYFDFDLFKNHVEKAQRLMDDIVDLELEQINKIIKKVISDPEPIEIKRIEIEMWKKIRQKAEQGRRTGLGVTAEGDMLAALNFRYGSTEANNFCESVHKELATYCYKSSIQLAGERGCFPIWSLEKEKNNPFIRRIMFGPLMNLTHGGDGGDYGPVADYYDVGRRNISCLTIAPTGTTSLMTQTTSGIEPLFLPIYERRKKVNPSDTNVRVDYVDEQGDSWEKYNVFHKGFLEWFRVNHLPKTSKIIIITTNLVIEKYLNSLSKDQLQKLVKESPYYKSTIDDIDWVAKVELQGRIQKWNDHSISVTVNVPKATTKKMIEDIYMTAWKSGCKGCTIYREGSRDGILLRKEEEVSTNGDNHAKERPIILDAQMVFFQNNKEKWVAFIGVLDNRPYEIFTGKVDEKIATIPKTPNATGGKIVKTKIEGINRYDFHGVDYSNRPIVIEGISNCFDPEFWNYAKLISGVLRQRMNLPKVINLVEELNFKEENINIWKVGVIRALKQFIPEGTEVKGKCPECGQTDFIYQEGCLICKNCGYGKC